MPAKTKVKLWTHGFLADDHLLDLHDLCDVVGCWLERRSTRPVVDANENLSVYIFTAVNTYQRPTHHTHAHTHTSSGQQLTRGFILKEKTD